MNGGVTLAAWLASGLTGIGLIHRYFVRNYDDGLRPSQWLPALLGPLMLMLAINLLLEWGREDRKNAEEQGA